MTAVAEAEKNMKIYWQGRAESFGFDERIMDKLAATAKMYMPGGKLCVLDVGCGTGVVTAAMASAGHEVTAVDLCSNMLEKAEENLKKLGLAAKLSCASAERLPFPDDYFDAVVSRNLLWALPEPEKALCEWKRVLKPGGMLLYWDGNHYRYMFDEKENSNRQKLVSMAGTAHSAHGKNAAGSTSWDSTLCDETALSLPLSRINRPAGWDERMLPVLGFDIVGEEIRHPEALLKYGETEGFYANFFIAAKCGKDTGLAENGWDAIS